MRVIGLTGPAGVGKTTIATEMAKRGYRIISFAEPLKAMLRAYYETLGLSPAEIQSRMAGDLKEAPDQFLGGRSPRYAMQTLGTEWARELIDPNIWIAAWETRVLRGKAPVVVDDVRFQNEADAVDRFQGWVIELSRPGIVRNPVHASERGVVSDLVIANDRDPVEVAREVCAVH